MSNILSTFDFVKIKVANMHIIFEIHKYCNV